MHTMTINVQDTVYERFLKFLQKEEIPIIKDVQDENLKRDPYFYERKAQLEKTIEAVDNGTMEMYEQGEYDKEMDSFMRKLEEKHADS